MRLVVEEGYNRGAEVIVGDDPVVLGRGEGATVQLLDDGVSRRHVELRSKGDRLVVADLGSRNGTRLNGVPIVESAEAFPGDRIALGGVRLLVVARVDATIARAPTAEVALDGSPATLAGPFPVAGFDPGELLGDSPAIRALLQALARAAPKAATILVQGESGTGKELVARAIHRLSPRRQAPFVVLNGAALPQELVESEIFGHEKGAFTGALARKAGLAEAAHGGTLFLDELGELPLPVQAKLLRFIESGEVVRVGSTQPFRVDVRLVAATHRDLDAMVKERTFREDLLYRLRVVELRVPPLRERPGDVKLLAQAFLKRFAGERARFDDAALAALEGHGWPGNVRELRNAVEAATIAATGAVIGTSELPARVRAREGALPARPRTLREAELAVIKEALERAGGNRTKAAEELGIDRKTLGAKLKDQEP